MTDAATIAKGLTKAQTCDWCQGGPVWHSIDGEALCGPCADKWCEGERRAILAQETDR